MQPQSRNGEVGGRSRRRFGTQTPREPARHPTILRYLDNQGRPDHQTEACDIHASALSAELNVIDRSRRARIAADCLGLARYGILTDVAGGEKPLDWVGTSRDDLRTFPQQVRSTMAYALLLAENGEKHPDAKPLHGFGGAGVVEMVDDWDGSTYRAVYTVKFESAVYVLHAFQKKSHKGIATPKSDLDLIKIRLKQAEEADRIAKQQRVRR